jgi:peptide/nickel transport system ATP-binding protein
MRKDALVARDLCIRSRIGGRTRTIVSGVNLSVGPGETVGIVGESGSGKSITARAMLGLLPTGVVATGSVEHRGRNLLELPERELVRIRGGEIGLVFQDPFTMLNPLRRVGRHIDEMLRATDGGRLRRGERHSEAVRRLAEVGILDPTVAGRFPFELSGGMRQRVGIAAALARDPDFLIADEPSTALDVTTQREILRLLKAVQRSRGMGLVMITHDLRVAFSMCDRIYVLYAGSLIEAGPALDVEAEPFHPYTLGLLLSELPANHRLAQLFSIAGNVPDPDSVSSECPFAPRCEWVLPKCRIGAPPLLQVSPKRLSACVRLDEIRVDMERRRRTATIPLDVVDARPATPLLLQVQGLRKVFSSGQRIVTALDDVAIEIREGESVGLVGESGSGKTTFGRCLVGLESSSSGSIVIDGLDCSSGAGLAAAERRQLRRTVQIVFQDPYSSLNPVRTVGWTLKEALGVHTERVRDMNAKVNTLLEQVGLPSSYATRKPVALSGGERQRVAIARAIAVKPKLLVCDEPVSALDVSVQAQILNLLAELRAKLGISYLLITHDLAVVRQVVEYVYVLYRGEVVESGPTEQVLRMPQHAYTRQLLESVPRSDSAWLDINGMAAATSAKKPTMSSS